MENDKTVDESWKESANQQKDILLNTEKSEDKEDGKIYVNEPLSDSQEEETTVQEEEATTNTAEPTPDVQFINYISSLGYQALIFLGEIPNPVTNKQEKNLDQSKLLIDTLVMIRDKTKGNLTTQEENLLTASIYELQLKYVEISSADESKTEENN